MDTNIRFVRRSPCSICDYKKICEEGKIDECPCKKCLVKPMCTTTCEEAQIYFKDLWDRSFGTDLLS